MPEKKCNLCGRVLSLDNFYRHPGTVDKHQGCCKECYLEKQKTRYMRKKQEQLKQIKQRDCLSYLPPSKLINLAENSSAKYRKEQAGFTKVMKVAESDFKAEEKEGQKVWTRK